MMKGRVKKNQKKWRETGLREHLLTFFTWQFSVTGLIVRLKVSLVQLLFPHEGKNSSLGVAVYGYRF